MENTNNINAANSRPRHVVHRRASSDSLAILKNKHLVLTPSAHSVSLADPSQKPRSSKKLKLLPESSHRLEHETPKLVPNPAPLPPMDPQRHKKLLANRVSAYNYRQRKNEYVERLEKRVEYEQLRLNFLAPQVAYSRHQQAALIMQNNALQERLAVLEIENAARDARHQALREERDRLLAVRAMMWARIRAAFN